MSAPTTVDVALYSILSTDDGLVPLVRDRIYPVIAPQNTDKPFITYERITSARVSSLASDSGHVNAVFQVSVWASSRDDAVTIAEKVLDVLARYKGSVSGIVIDDVFVQNQIDLYDANAKLFQIPIDFDIWYVEV